MSELKMRHKSFLIVIRVVAAVTALYAIDRLSIRPLQCARVVRIVETQIAEIDRLPQDRVAEISRSYILKLEKLVPYCRTDVDLHIALALLESQLGHHEAALRHLDDALSADTRPEIYFDRGLEYFYLGRIEDSVDQFAIACEFNMRLLDSIQGELRERVSIRAQALQRLHARLPKDR